MAQIGHPEPRLKSNTEFSFAKKLKVLDPETGGQDATGQALRFDRCLIYQHDRDAISYRIDAMTLCALQGFRVLAVFKRLLASWTDEDFE